MRIEPVRNKMIPPYARPVVATAPVDPKRKFVPPPEPRPAPPLKPEPWKTPNRG